MGMPGSETALEELMCRVLGDLVSDRIAVKFSDDLHIGAVDPQKLLVNWGKALAALLKAGLRLFPKKTVVCPVKTTVLFHVGWIWQQGSLRADPHRISTLKTCDSPKNSQGPSIFHQCL